jgi:hypothetical protein
MALGDLIMTFQDQELFVHITNRALDVTAMADSSEAGNRSKTLRALLASKTRSIINVAKSFREYSPDRKLLDDICDDLVDFENAMGV